MSLPQPVPSSMLLARNLRRLRERAELSIAELAERTGMSAKRLDGIEGGRIDAYLDDLDRIAGAFGIAIALLFVADGFENPDHLAATTSLPTT